jgi:hypothetical protein
MKEMNMVLRKLLAALMAAGALNGCAMMQSVQPWEKDLLAKEEMQLVPDRIEEFFDSRVYFSREAAFGGKGVGGGGCGCN